MPWFSIPLALLIAAAVGLVLSIRSYKASEALPVRRLLTIGALIFLGGGVFLQKMGVVDVPELQRLAVSLDPDPPTTSPDVDVDAR